MANTKITSRVLADNAVLTANITDANVTTAKIAADAITGAKIADDVALGGNPTTSTQSAGNNTTRVATTAFVSTAVSNLVDSSPSALNTLNELAAALGDDANFSTTVTNSIAAKLPLAGGTMTGNLAMGSNNITSSGTITGTLATAAQTNITSLGTLTALTGGTGDLVWDTTTLVVDSSANRVGIGTASPAGLLHVDSSATTEILLEGTKTSDGAIVDISFRNGSDSIAAIQALRVSNNDQADLAFSTQPNSGAVTERMRIQSDGRVGIGATPSDYWGTANGLVVREGDNSTGITIATSTSNTGQIYFADGTSGDARYRGWITYAHGTDTMSLATSASTHMVLDSAGKLGIGNGTNDPGARLLVKSLGGGTELVFKTTDASNNMVFEVQGGGKAHFNYGPVLIGSTTDVMHANMDDLQVGHTSGNKGITIVSGSDSYGTLAFADGSSGNEAYRGFVEYFHNDDSMRLGAAGSERMRITSGDGIVGIGVTDPKAHIHTHIASSGGAYHQFTNASTNANSDDGWKIGIHDDENFIIWGQESSESFRVYNNGAYRFTIDHNGAVSVAGSFSKGSGSFKIDHPLPAKKDTHHLVHSFVEAPQADLIYRGTATLSSGTATVNLDTIAGMTEGTYVLLNTNSSCFTSNETDWDAVKGSVSGNILTINCQNSSSTATVSWLVIGERHDKHMIDTEWTDDNGKVIVEPLKEE